MDAQWNPFTLVHNIEKIATCVRKTRNNAPQYREVQVKFGKLYRVGAAWERKLFDVTSWRFFREDEFDRAGQHLFVAYVLSEDDQYRGDFFVFPVREFASIIRKAPIAGGKRRVYISRCLGNPEHWVLRRRGRFDEVRDETCLDVSRYRRNFAQLEQGS